LKTWGVTEADVEGVTQEEASAKSAGDLPPELLAEASRRFEPFFACTDRGHPAVRELFRLCVLRAARSGALPPEDGPEEIPAEAPAPSRPRGIGTPETLVRGEVELSSFPDIYFRISEVLRSPRSSAAHIADVVGKDTSLSTRLLRLVNSAFYGFPAKIDSIPRAIAILGTNELTTLAMGISVVERFKGIPAGLMDMKRFWTHSIACGVIARILAASRVGLSEERFFVAGLIHDVGRLVLFKKLPHQATETLRLARYSGIPLHEAEQAVLGFDHAQVGGRLLKEWKFPSSLQLPVVHHHQPMAALNTLDPSILHLADLFAVALRLGATGSAMVPRLEERAWEALGQSPSIIAPTISQAERQIHEIYRAFLGEGSTWT